LTDGHFARQKKVLISLASKLAKDINTEADFNALSIELMKLTVETALNAGLTEHFWL
jgi:putative transposase